MFGEVQSKMILVSAAAMRCRKCKSPASDLCKADATIRGGFSCQSNDEIKVETLLSHDIEQHANIDSKENRQSNHESHQMGRGLQEVENGSSSDHGGDDSRKQGPAH